MNKNDLKSMWYDARNGDREIIYDRVNIEKSISMKHSKAISGILLDVKLKILVYSAVLIVFIGMMIYAFSYLDLRFSINSIIPFFLAGLFLLIKTTSEIKRLFIISRTAENMSVKESLLLFNKMLNRIKAIDFYSYLIFLYPLTFGIAYSYIVDAGGIWKVFNGSGFVPLIMILISVLLFTPWFIRYQHNQHYKKTYSDIKDSVNLLNETV